MALHGDDPVQGAERPFTGIFRAAQPLDLKRVEAFIVAKIGWRCLHPAPDHIVAHLLQCGSTYANLTDEEGALDILIRDDFVRRCANVSRMVACQDYFFSLPPTIVAAGVLYHVRKSLLTEETAWNPGLEQLSGYASDLVKDVADLLVDLIPDPTLPAWPWIHMGDARDSTKQRRAGHNQFITRCFPRDGTCYSINTRATPASILHSANPKLASKNSVINYSAGALEHRFAVRRDRRVSAATPALRNSACDTAGLKNAANRCAQRNSTAAALHPWRSAA